MHQEKKKEITGTHQLKTYQFKETIHYCEIFSSVKFEIPNVIQFKPEFW